MNAFITPIQVSAPVGNHRSRVCKQRPSCVLQEPPRIKVQKPPRPDKSKYYHVIQPEDDPATLPPTPPVHRSVPFIGYLLEHMLGMATPASRASKYGALYESSFFFNNFVWVTKMEPMHDMLRDPAVFSSNIEDGKFRFLIGVDSMLFADGPPHIAERNKIAPAFSPSMFPLYFEGLRATTERFWERLAEDTNSKALKLDPELRKFYMGITIELTTGVSADSELSERVRNLFMGFLDGIVGPTFGPWWDRTVRQRAEIVEILTAIINNKLVNEADIIEQLRLNIQEHGTVRNVKSLLENGADILQVVLAGLPLKTGPNQTHDPEEFRKLVDLLLLLWGAGFFTTAATTSCGVFEMGVDTNIMQRLVVEQDEIVMQAGSTQLQYEQLEKMPLLDSYLYEIMRLYPAGNGIMRMVEKDVVLLGKKVTKGTMLFFDLQAALRDEDIYPNALTLVMDRFMKKQNGGQEAQKALVFGGQDSPHFCVGAALARLMMKTNLVTLLRHYRIELDPKQTKKYRLLPDYSPASEVVVNTIAKRT